MKFTELPKLGAPLDAGIFAGVITQKDGAHVAVALLPERAENMTWAAAIAWAGTLNATLPTRPVAAMLFANLMASLPTAWHWTSEEVEGDADKYAWDCHFSGGYQGTGLKSCEGAAVAVRFIVLE